MENISVKTLCPDAHIEDKHNKVFGVDNMIMRTDKQEKQFNVGKLIKIRKQKRKKLLENYVKLYNNCLTNIETVNDVDKTDLYFNVPNKIVGCPEYNSNDCIEYIENKLREQFIDTIKINDNTIFVSWLYLELNMEQNKN